MLVVRRARRSRFSSLLEWMTRNRPTHWHAIGEADNGRRRCSIATQSVAGSRAHTLQCRP